MPYKNPEDKKRADARYWRRIKGDGATGNTAARFNRPVGVVQRLKIKVPKHGLRIMVVTDTQLMHGVPMEHLKWAGMYAARKQPDVIVHIGDVGDYPSMGHFGRGTASFASHRLAKDVAAVQRGLTLFQNEVDREAGYSPLQIITMGNHDDHPARYEEEHPEIQGSLPDIAGLYSTYGWKTYPFLQPISIADVAFCHYFPSGQMGRPISSAPEILRKLHMSAFAGHQQGREIAYSRRADGSTITAIISGSFYQHQYKYLSPFTNGHWRGMFMLHEVREGRFDDMAVSIDFLKRKFA